MNFRHHRESVFCRPKVQKQLLTIFMIVLIIPAALCLFLLFQSGRSLYQHYQDQTQADNLRVKSILFDITLNLTNLAESLSADSSLISLLEASYETDSEAQKAIDHYCNQATLLHLDTSISSLKIYTFNEQVSDHSYFYSISDEVRQSTWFQQASDTASVFWKSCHRSDEHDNLYWELTLYRRIPLVRSSSYAVLALAVSDNYLKNRIDTTSYNTFITVNEDPVFYSSQKIWLGQDLPLEVDRSLPYFHTADSLVLDGKKTITAVSTLVPMNSEDKIYLISSDPNALNDIYSLMCNYLLIMCATILLPCVLFILYSKYFSGRILMLRKAMHQASQGSYDIIDSFTGNDEISETFHDLRTMIQEIQTKEALIYQARIREAEIQNRQQQMEFKMLASQINPHFLYNTLETIRMKAFTAGAKDVATAIKLLGKSMRYVLENTGTVSIPLTKELDYIHTYIAIQKLRFGDRINYQEEIAPELELSEYKTLPLLLQPIIENSISHGLKDLEKGGWIFLKIFEQESYLIIQISDNGKGLLPDDLQKLLQIINTTDETRTKSIGIYNINHRLQLCYGSDCTLQMTSIPWQETMTTLRFPLKKIKEEEPNETFDRR